MVRSLVGFLVIAAAVALHGAIPDARPAWVPAERALNADGTFREELFGSWIGPSRRIAERNGNSQECRFAVGPPVADDFLSTPSLEKLATNARSIVSGTVISIEQGFYYGRPGSLLRLEPMYVKGAARGSATYLFYPLAKISTAHGLVCTHPLGDYAAPEVGDRVLVFTMDEPRVTTVGTILSVDIRRQLIHEASNSDVRLPAAFVTDAGVPKTFDAVRRRVTEIVRANDRKR
jgi:hypothetical protein